MTKSVQDRLAGCILAGAIGDAWGSSAENQLATHPAPNTFYLHPLPTPPPPTWRFTDDTQLTLVTLEALTQHKALSPAHLAQSLTTAYTQGQLTGLGASTLKALRDLQAGAHWSQTGRQGEYGAGNGAAMRIAPFAFWPQYSRTDVQTFCRITHRHEEAYVGALAIVLAIRAILSNQWTGTSPLLNFLTPHLPDTRVRDRLLEIQALRSPTIAEVARLGTSGYVVDSVPFALFCAEQVPRLGLPQILASIIAAGGDTDTNASLAGQVAGTWLGQQHLPATLLHQLEQVSGYARLQQVVQNATAALPFHE